MTEHQATNIPTELLRTLIAVAELRSFTKAANLLGVTQPAVSAQIKRLQVLLDTELFDKSAPGVALTEKGELVVNYGMRMLALNDQILGLVGSGLASPMLRVGIPGDFAAAVLPTVVARFQAGIPQLRVQLRGDTSANVLRDLRQGQLDLGVALTMSGPALGARHHWFEDAAWICGPSAPIDASGRVSLVTLREGTLNHRVTLMSLNQAAREYDVAFLAPSLASLLTSVATGIGVALLSRRDVTDEVEVCKDGLLPPAPDVYCGVYVREGSSDIVTALADTIANALKPEHARLAPQGTAPADESWAIKD